VWKSGKLFFAARKELGSSNLIFSRVLVVFVVVFESGVAIS
jgi:hypothetical protein